MDKRLDTTTTLPQGAHQALLNYYGEEVFNESKEKRREDLIVYFALSQFEKRKPQTKLPESLKRDIKAFFSSYQQALEESRATLFSVGSPDTIYEACEAAYELLGCGHMEEGHSFTFHKDFLGDLSYSVTNLHWVRNATIW